MPFYRRHHNTAHPKLLQQLFVQFSGCGSDNDTIKRRLARPTQVTVSVSRVNVIQSQLVKSPPGLFEQLFYPFDSEYFRNQGSQDGRKKTSC